jgi:hypothetical protein
MSIEIESSDELEQLRTRLRVSWKRRVPSGGAGIPGRCDGLTAVVFFREQSRAENAQRTGVPRVAVE